MLNYVPLKVNGNRVSTLESIPLSKFNGIEERANISLPTPPTPLRLQS